jgi:hypothetical protein
MLGSPGAKKTFADSMLAAARAAPAGRKVESLLRGSLVQKPLYGLRGRSILVELSLAVAMRTRGPAKPCKGEN